MNPEDNKNIADLTKQPNSTDSALNSLSSAIFYLAILFFIIGFNFSDVMVGNWYQQFMPSNLPNFQISDITFLDSLTGFAVTGNSAPNDSSGYILKTTNRGDSWQLQLAEYRDFSRVKFINQNTGFVSGGYNTGARLYKTTNAGTNWLLMNGPGGQIFYDDISVLSEDTIWIAISQTATGGVFLTTNGGVSWQQQVNLGGNNPDKIYMYNARIGFISRTNSPQLRKTTNGGVNWNLLSGTGTGAFSDIYFIDSLTGWKAKAVGGGGWLMGKSTDGGINWIEQFLPSGGNIISQGTQHFSNINKDTIWSANGVYRFPNNQLREILYKTLNGGDTWFYQIPDTSIIMHYEHSTFINKLNGWFYDNSSPTGIHTTNGGDTTFYLPVKQISNEVPKDFSLKQNFPNPFNSMTKLKFQMSKQGYAEIKLFDVTGREVSVILNESLNTGEYEIIFNLNYLSSGVYFYSLTVEGILIDTKRMILIK